MSEDPLRAVADHLYALAPGEFTPARDAEAKAARDDGDRALAERVKRLRKPSSAAWVVNMLMRHRQDQMVQVLDLGESLRRAQADLDADGLRELTRQRRRLIAAVAGDGRALARELGQKVSESVARQVEDTLHAAMIDTDAAAAVRTGMLLDALTPAGVGSLKEASAIGEHTALGALEASPGPASGSTSGSASGSAARGRAGLSVVRDKPAGRASGTPQKRAGSRGTGAQAGAATGEEAERERREREEQEARAAEERAAEEHRRAIDEADRAVAAAEDAADAAKQRRRKAGKRVAKLEASGLQLQSEAEELRRRLAEVEHEAEALDEETSEAEERRDTAQQRLDEAEARLEEARQRRADLDG